ncbi:hypothetical protein F5B17DRAFT_184302 [Nemania serpens]|nr:hypothetical protein F5B17DRAFT_184302 [Nemania serpens]
MSRDMSRDMYGICKYFVGSSIPYILSFLYCPFIYGLRGLIKASDLGCMGQRGRPGTWELGQSGGSIPVPPCLVLSHGPPPPPPACLAATYLTLPAWLVTDLLPALGILYCSVLKPTIL